MRRPAVVFALFVVLLAPALALPRAVEACSIDPNFDPIEETDVAFAGTVVGLRVAEELWDGVNAFVPVWVDFEVDSYLKGSGPTTFSALDRVSVIFNENLEAAHENDFSGAQFAGPAGACGALSEDPRGQYWVTAVERTGGHYEISIGLVVARGADANDPVILAALGEVDVTPASTGHGAVPATDRGVPFALAITALAILGAARLVTRERSGV